MLRPKYLQKNIVAFVTLALVILYITVPTLAQRTNRKNSESSGSKQAMQQQAERERQQQAERAKQQQAEQARQQQAEQERQQQAEQARQQQAERERQQQAERERQHQRSERMNRKQLIINPNDRDLELRTDDEMSGRVNRKLPSPPNDTKTVVVDNSAHRISDLSLRAVKTFTSGISGSSICNRYSSP